MNITKKYKFTIQLTGQSSINIDYDEVEDVLNKLPSGQFIHVRSGIFNPAHLIKIVENPVETKNCTTRIKNSDGKVVEEYLKCKDVFKGYDFKKTEQLLIK